MLLNDDFIMTKMKLCLRGFLKIAVTSSGCGLLASHHIVYTLSSPSCDVSQPITSRRRVLFLSQGEEALLFGLLSLCGGWQGLGAGRRGWLGSSGGVDLADPSVHLSLIFALVEEVSSVCQLETEHMRLLAVVGGHAGRGAVQLDASLAPVCGRRIRFGMFLILVCCQFLVGK